MFFSAGTSLRNPKIHANDSRPRRTGVRSHSRALGSALLISVLVFPGLLSAKDQDNGKEKDPEHSLKARVQLGDGRLIEGIIRVRAPEKLLVQHIADGLTYEKEVQLEEIREIKIERWQGQVVRENGKERIFEFRPSRFTLLMKDGAVLKLQRPMFPFFLSFPLYNKNGRVTLFTYWGDMKDKGGEWRSGLRGSESDRVICHPDAVSTIEFSIPDAPPDTHR